MKFLSDSKEVPSEDATIHFPTLRRASGAQVVLTHTDTRTPTAPPC